MSVDRTEVGFSPGGPVRVVLLAVVAALLAGCQVRVTTDVTVEDDGGGQATLTVVVDDELRDELEAAGVDLREGLTEAAAGASWTVRAVDRPDATGVELATSFSDPSQLGERVDALTAGLAADDGALLADVELALTDDGGYAFRADAGLDPPRILGTLPLAADADADADEGATSATAGLDGDALGDVLAASGDRYATAELRLHVPTVPDAPDADVSGTTATWTLPVDGLRTVTATAPPVPVAGSTAVVAAAVAGAVLVLVFALRLVRRPG